MMTMANKAGVFLMIGLSLPKMSFEANAFEISEIQKDETESVASSSDQRNNVTSH